MVKKYSLLAISSDSRFEKLTLTEWKSNRFELKINLLSPIVPFEKKIPDDFRIGVYGLELESQGKSAYYLPSVFSELLEQGVQMDRILESLCLKAGLNLSCYQDEGTKFKYNVGHEFGFLINS